MTRLIYHVCTLKWDRVESHISEDTLTHDVAHLKKSAYRWIWTWVGRMVLFDHSGLDEPSHNVAQTYMCSCTSHVLSQKSCLMTKPTKWHVPQAKTQISLIRDFAVRMKKHWVLSYPLSTLQRRCLDWEDRSFSWFGCAAAQMSLGTAKPIIQHVQTLRPALISTQSDQSLCCLHQDVGPWLPIKHPPRTITRCVLDMNFYSTHMPF